MKELALVHKRILNQFHWNIHIPDNLKDKILSRTLKNRIEHTRTKSTSSNRCQCFHMKRHLRQFYVNIIFVEYKDNRIHHQFWIWNVSYQTVDSSQNTIQTLSCEHINESSRRRLCLFIFVNIYWFRWLHFVYKIKIIIFRNSPNWKFSRRHTERTNYAIFVNNLIQA